MIQASTRKFLRNTRKSSSRCSKNLTSRRRPSGKPTTTTTQRASRLLTTYTADSTDRGKRSRHPRSHRCGVKKRHPRGKKKERKEKVGWSKRAPCCITR